MIRRSILALRARVWSWRYEVAARGLMALNALPGSYRTPGGMDVWQNNDGWEVATALRAKALDRMNRHAARVVALALARMAVAK